MPSECSAIGWGRGRGSVDCLCSSIDHAFREMVPRPAQHTFVGLPMTYFMLTQIIMEEKNLEHCPEENFFYYYWFIQHKIV